MYTSLREFNYQPPEMYYDKESGEIKVREKEVDTSKKRIIRSVNDLEKEK